MAVTMQPFKDHGIADKWGGGLQYAITKRIGARAEYERYNNVSGTYTDFASVGFSFHF